MIKNRYNDLSRYYGLLVAFVFILSACGRVPTHAPTPTATEITLPTLTPTATSAPTLVPTPTPTPEPTWNRQIDASYSVLQYRYGMVSNPYAKVYLTLEDAMIKNGNYGFLPSSPAYVAIDGEEIRKGITYYHNLLGWMSSEDVQLVTPSTFRGILLTREVDFRFGWVLKETESLNATGTPIRTYSRYEIVHEVPAEAEKPGFIAIGPDEWLPLDSLALTSPQVPEEAGTGTCRFIHVDLSAQIVRVFDTCKLVFATLVSTGKNPAWTYTGQFPILNKVEFTQLTRPNQSISDYYLQAVPYFMTYNYNLGFHGTYWHDDFGSPVSHGCINLSTADAKWLYEWAREGDNVIIVRPETP